MGFKKKFQGEEKEEKRKKKTKEKIGLNIKKIPQKYKKRFSEEEPNKRNGGWSEEKEA